MFTETLNKFNSCKIDDYEINDNIITESMSYSEFVDEVYDIHRCMQETINEYCRDINTSKIILETSGEHDLSVIKEKDKTFIEKMKSLVDRMIEAIKKAINNIIEWIKEKVNYYDRFINKYEKQIRETNLSYDKNKSSISSIKTYKGILNAQIGDHVLISDNDIEGFLNQEGRIDRQAVNEFYILRILGSKTKDHEIDIDEIDSHKDDLIRIVKTASNHIKTVRKVEKELLKEAKEMEFTAKLNSKGCFGELHATAQGWHIESLNKLDSTREYIKIVLECINTAVSILRLYIDTKKDSDKKEENM